MNLPVPPTEAENIISDTNAALGNAMSKSILAGVSFLGLVVLVACLAP
jgi:hypothetical protein